MGLLHRPEERPRPHGCRWTGCRDDVTPMRLTRDHDERLDLLLHSHTGADRLCRVLGRSYVGRARPAGDHPRRGVRPVTCRPRPCQRAGPSIAVLRAPHTTWKPYIARLCVPPCAPARYPRQSLVTCSSLRITARTRTADVGGGGGRRAVRVHGRLRRDGRAQPGQERTHWPGRSTSWAGPPGGIDAGDIYLITDATARVESEFLHEQAAFYRTRAEDIAVAHHSVVRQRETSPVVRHRCLGLNAECIATLQNWSRERLHLSALIEGRGMAYSRRYIRQSGWSLAVNPPGVPSAPTRRKTGDTTVSRRSSTDLRVAYADAARVLTPLRGSLDSGNPAGHPLGTRGQDGQRRHACPCVLFGRRAIRRGNLRLIVRGSRTRCSRPVADTGRRLYARGHRGKWRPAQSPVAAVVSLPAERSSHSIRPSRSLRAAAATVHRAGDRAVGSGLHCVAAVVTLFCAGLESCPADAAVTTTQEEERGAPTAADRRIRRGRPNPFTAQQTQIRAHRIPWDFATIGPASSRRKSERPFEELSTRFVFFHAVPDTTLPSSCRAR
jgi:hypothetical protein